MSNLPWPSDKCQTFLKAFLNVYIDFDFVFISIYVPTRLNSKCIYYIYNVINTWTTHWLIQFMCLRFFDSAKKNVFVSRSTCNGPPVDSCTQNKRNSLCFMSTCHWIRGHWVKIFCTSHLKDKLDLELIGKKKKIILVFL